MIHEKQRMETHTFQQEDMSLCTAARAGDSHAMEQLMHQYARLVKACTRPYFLNGADGEDLTQEGMIALWLAVQSFNASMHVPFEAYARLCINRKIYSAVRAASAKKHQPLNNSISIEKPLFDNNASSRPQVAEPTSDPEILVIGMEEQQERVQALLGVLSTFEAKVLNLFLDGLSYEEMAKILEKPLKSVDNAIQRIRRKSAAINP